MRIAIHQPNFLPWLGYFAKMAQCDHFVYLDDVQFSKNGYTNRNLIKTSQGPHWLTVPVINKNHTEGTIREVRINNTVNWKKKHLGIFEMNYRRSRRYENLMDGLRVIYQKDWNLLSELNLALLEFVRSQLCISTPVSLSSQYKIQTHGTQRLIDIILQLRGTCYVSGRGGDNYQESVAFTQTGMDLRYYQYEDQPYQQLWGDYKPSLSIIDFLFNTDAPQLFFKRLFE